jgi:hypothetical protein
MHSRELCGGGDPAHCNSSTKTASPRASLGLPLSQGVVAPRHARRLPTRRVAAAARIDSLRLSAGHSVLTSPATANERRWLRDQLRSRLKAKGARHDATFIHVTWSLWTRGNCGDE